MAPLGHHTESLKIIEQKFVISKSNVKIIEQGAIFFTGNN